MKKISMFFLFVSIGVNLNAQQSIQEKITSTPQPKTAATNKEVKLEKSKNKSTTISIRAGESQVIHDEAYYNREVTRIDEQINAINTKVSIVTNDPVEKVNATNSGWFDDMERIKSELESRKLEIQNHQN